jgi:penicillin-binding protein 1A
MTQSKKKSKPSNMTSTWIKRLWMLFGIGVVLFVLFMFTLTLGWWGYMPDIKALEDPRTSLASEIYSEDGEILGKLYFREDRTNIEYSDIPKQMVDALRATEDVRFYKHSGIDAKSLFRAITLLGARGGGSTITQQLAKNLFHPEKHNKLERIIQKFKEWVISVQLEKRYTKDEIVMMYFNTASWGRSTGVKSAAKTFFNKTTDELNVQESAVLVGMLKAPTTYNPKRNPELALNRRNTVLSQMKKYKFIEKEAFDSLRLLPIELDYNLSSHDRGIATYFREYVHQFMKAWCKKKGLNVYDEGLKIYTTIDSRMQEYAEKAMEMHMAELQGQFFSETKRNKANPWRDEELKWKEDSEYIPKHLKRTPQYLALKNEGKSEAAIEEAMNVKTPMTIFSWTGDIDTMFSVVDSLKYYKQILHTGFMAMNPKTGSIKAWVGGIDFRHFKYDHVNKNSTRQVGSTFKPIVYARALEDGVIQPCEVIPTSSVTFELEDGNTWTPSNSTEPKATELRVYECLKQSLNTGTARVMKRMEPQSPMKVKDFSDKLGIDTRNFVPFPSICLGTMDISVLEMVGAYGAFANQGIWTEPIFITRIEDKNGNVLEEFIPKSQEAMSKQTAYTMSQMLQRVTEGGGTAARLRFKYDIRTPVGGKTGTTQNNSDGWFMGITPDLVAGTWVGCEDRQVHFRSTSLGQGANMALPIFGIFLKKIYADQSIKISKDNFARPEGETTIELDCEVYDKNHKENGNDEGPVPGIGR